MYDMYDFLNPQQSQQSVPTQPPIAPPAQPMMQALTQPMPAATPLAPQQQTPMNMDAWQPHHTTTLGKIADLGLALLGFPLLPFTRHVQRENMQEAMQNFTTNPLETIQRIAKIPGHEKQALDMYEKYTDDQARDSQVAALNEQRKEHYRDRVGAMLGAVTPDNAGALLPKIRSYAQAMGLNADDVPSSYDKDQINLYRMGAVPVDNQIDNQVNAAYKSARLGQIDETIQSTNRYRTSRLNQMSQNQSEQERHNQVMESISQQRANRMKKYGVSYIQTKYGPGEVSPDGNSLKVTVGDTDHIYSKTGPNTWRHVKSMKHDPKQGYMTNSGAPYDPEDDDDEDDN